MSNKKPAPKMSAQKESSSIELLRKIYFKTGTLFKTDFERAEEMHKKEVIDAWQEGAYQQSLLGASEYYNEIFGGNNE